MDTTNVRSLFAKFCKPLEDYYASTYEMSKRTAGEYTTARKLPSNRGLGALREYTTRMESALAVLGSAAGSPSSKASAEETVRDLFKRVSSALQRWNVVDLPRITKTMSKLNAILGGAEGDAIVAEDERKQLPPPPAMPPAPPTAPESAAPAPDAPPAEGGTVDDRVRALVRAEVAPIAAEFREFREEMRAESREVRGILGQMLDWFRNVFDAKESPALLGGGAGAARPQASKEEVPVTSADAADARDAADGPEAEPIDSMIACAVEAMIDAEIDAKEVQLLRVKGSTKKLIIHYRPTDARVTFTATSANVGEECAAVRAHILSLGKASAPAREHLPHALSMKVLASQLDVDMTRKPLDELVEMLRERYEVLDEDVARLRAEHLRFLRWHDERGNKIARHVRESYPELAEGGKPAPKAEEPAAEEPARRESPRELATPTEEEAQLFAWAETADLAAVKARKAKMDEALRGTNLGYASVADGRRKVGITSDRESFAKHITEHNAENPGDALIGRKTSHPSAAGDIPHVVYGLARNAKEVEAFVELFERFKGFGRTDAQRAEVSQALGYSDDDIRQYLARERVASILARRERETDKTSGEEKPLYPVGSRVVLVEEKNKAGEVTARAHRAIGGKGAKVYVYTVLREDGKTRQDIRQKQLREAPEAVAEAKPTKAEAKPSEAPAKPSALPARAWLEGKLAEALPGPSNATNRAHLLAAYDRGGTNTMTIAAEPMLGGLAADLGDVAVEMEAKFPGSRTNGAPSQAAAPTVDKGSAPVSLMLDKGDAARIGNVLVKRLTIEEGPSHAGSRTIVKVKLSAKPNDATANTLRGHFALLLATSGPDAPYWYGYPYPIDADDTTYREPVIMLVNELSGASRLPAPIGADGGPNRAQLLAAIARDKTFAGARAAMSAEHMARAAAENTPERLAEIAERTGSPSAKEAAAERMAQLVEERARAAAAVAPAPAPANDTAPPVEVERVPDVSAVDPAPVPLAPAPVVESAPVVEAPKPAASFFDVSADELAAQSPLEARIQAMFAARGIPNMKPKYTAGLARAITHGEFHDSLLPDNKNSRAVFREITGVKLPASQRDTRALFKGQPFPVLAPGEAPAAAGEVVALAPERAPSKYGVGAVVERLGDGVNKTVERVAWDESKGQYVYQLSPAGVALEDELYPARTVVEAPAEEPAAEPPAVAEVASLPAGDEIDEAFADDLAAQIAAEFGETAPAPAPAAPAPEPAAPAQTAKQAAAAKMAAMLAARAKG